MQLSGEIALSDLAFPYAGARLFISPSLHERFGIPPLEVIVSRVLLVAVQGSGVIMNYLVSVALFVDPAQTDEVSEGMRAILMDDAR